MSKLIAPIRKKGMTLSYYTKDGWKVYELKSSTINGKSLKDVFLTKKYNPLIRSPKSGDWYVVSYNFRKNKTKPSKANYKIICHLITMDSDILRNDVIEAAEIFGLNPQMFGADSWSQFHKRDICKELSKAMVSFTGELFMDTPEIQDPELKVRLTADELGISQRDASEVIKIVQGTGSSESKWRRAMNYLWEHKYSAAAALAFVGALIWGVKSGNLQSLGSYGWEGLKSGASTAWDYARLSTLGSAVSSGLAGISDAATNIRKKVWITPEERNEMEQRVNERKDAERKAKNAMGIYDWWDGLTPANLDIIENDLNYLPKKPEPAPKPAPGPNSLEYYVKADLPSIPEPLTPGWGRPSDPLPPPSIYPTRLYHDPKKPRNPRFKNWEEWHDLVVSASRLDPTDGRNIALAKEREQDPNEPGPMLWWQPALFDKN